MNVARRNLKRERGKASRGDAEARRVSPTVELNFLFWASIVAISTKLVFVSFVMPVFVNFRIIV